MNQSTLPDLAVVCREVIALAEKTSAFLAEQNKGFSLSFVEYKGLNNLVSFVDKQAEQMVVEGCKAILPEAGFLTEEGTVSASEDSKKGLVWIIDPLDGTTNFVHKVPMFSVSIGLVLDGNPVLGVVAHVPDKQIFYAWQGGGAWCNGEPIRVSPTAKLAESLLATGFPYFDFGKMDTYLSIMNHLMKNSHGLRRIGSAAIDMVYVACGIFEGFFEFNLSPWDVAAGICIVREAGGTVTDFNGDDNALFGKQIVAAGPVHSEFLEVIRSRWN